MIKNSAGILLYRLKNENLEVFLVHPGGPFWMKKDDGAWSIPKGELENNEDAFTAAKREFKEETGFSTDGKYIPLSSVKQKSGKLVYVWAIKGDLDPDKIQCNTFLLEWPPRSGGKKEFPEIDKAAWFTVIEAEKKINENQFALILELVLILNAK